MSGVITSSTAKAYKDARPTMTAQARL